MLSLVQGEVPLCFLYSFINFWVWEI